MHKWLRVAVACGVLIVHANLRAAEAPPISYLRAQTSLGSNPKTRCPELRITDEGTAAVIVFWMPKSGIPSKVSIKSSSGSAAVDSAALSCFAKLRFAAATRVGDGEPIDSWQQVAFRRADPGNADDTRAISLPNPAAGAPAPTAATAVTVHVCVDATGRLEQEPSIVRSSGVASLDRAALRIAASGAADYRPNTAPNGPPVSGCAQLAIQFESK